MRINKRYIPKSLTKKDKIHQKYMLLKSRRLYKKGKYYTRKNVSSYKNKKSSHIVKAEKKYNVTKSGSKKEIENLRATS
jgi:hypothetical protein